MNIPRLRASPRHGWGMVVSGVFFANSAAGADPFGVVFQHEEDMIMPLFPNISFK